MKWEATVVDYPFDPEKRIIVISDIHGNLPVFQKLLAKIKFSTDDILVLLGDMLEKGPDNLALLRYIMALCHSHSVYPICGNCDCYIKRFFETDEFDHSFFQGFLAHPRNQQSILLQMGRESGLKNLKDLPLLRKVLNEEHQEVKQWLEALPTIINTPDYFFVHGGVEDMDKLEGLLEWDCMKNDYFYEKNHRFPKFMVVGHCPTTLYRPDYQDASPIIDRERNIISIDGGCVLKLDGQLNALLLHKGEISWEYEDGLPQVRALESQKASENPLNIRWGRSEVKKIQDNGEFQLCEHLETGRTISIYSKFLRQQKGKLYCEDATDYQLPVQANDVFSLSQVVTGGILGKKDGVTGWYWGKYELI